MPGDHITCPDCQGWPSCETGMLCMTCGGDGQIWQEFSDDVEEGFDAGEWTDTPKVVNVGDELHQILGEALKAAETKR